MYRREASCNHSKALRALTEHTSAEVAKHTWGDIEVVLAGSSAFNGEQTSSTLGEYIDGLHTRAANLEAGMWSRTRSSNSGLYDYYLFGDTHTNEWDQLQRLYSASSSLTPSDGSHSSLVPPVILPDEEPLPTLGIGGLYSGVAFHTHGAAWAEVIAGSKLWLLAPPATFTAPAKKPAPASSSDLESSDLPSDLNLGTQRDWIEAGPYGKSRGCSLNSSSASISTFPSL